MCGHKVKTVPDTKRGGSGVLVETGTLIRFGSYNISNRRNDSLVSSLISMYQANMDLGVFQETKVNGGGYTMGSAGCNVITADALSRNQGGVAESYYNLSVFKMEAHQHFIVNTISFQMVLCVCVGGGGGCFGLGGGGWGII